MNAEELHHLERCVELAEEALARGDRPFGSVLVSSSGERLREDSNRIKTSGEITAHPEIELARWASQNLSLEERRGATLYTSGEHCPMCAAAHVWAEIGRLVFILDAARIRELSRPGGVSFEIDAREIVRRSSREITVIGPIESLRDRVEALFR